MVIFNHFHFNRANNIQLLNTSLIIVYLNKSDILIKLVNAIYSVFYHNILRYMRFAT